MKYAVCIPTLNASATWPKFISVLRAHRLCPEQVLVIDSASTDDTVERARAEGFRVAQIERGEFNHGGTRQLAAGYFLDAEVLIYLTQDAILAQDDALPGLLRAFEDPSIGAAYGRQLPRPEAGAIEAHARLFNYPAQSGVRSLADRDRMGFKTIFISNSFAAYRRCALEAVGGFPSDVIFGEDTVVAGRMLTSGWKIAYVAEAQAYHSHPYTWRQEFKRYFDIGVLHARESWLRREFGQANGEGWRFVLSEMAYLWPRHTRLIPSAIVRTSLKLSGYRLGRMESKLSPRVKKRISMHYRFWEEFAPSAGSAASAGSAGLLAGCSGGVHARASFSKSGDICAETQIAPGRHDSFPRAKAAVAEVISASEK